MKISNWGNYPFIEARLINFKDVNKLRKSLPELHTFVPRGLGRCYGDSSLSKNIISTLKFNRILQFNKRKGVLTCEAGISLNEIIEVFVPRGWFLSVTPGTKYITLGGAIASDVHGKNHHKDGSFSDYVISMDIMLSNGEIKRCSKDVNANLFEATCGGMGLTGIILKASFQLKKIDTAYIKQKNLKARNVDEIIDLFESNNHYHYSVAWFDCFASGKDMGKGILMLGENAKIKDIEGMDIAHNPLVIKYKRKINIPFYLPSFFLNRFSLKTFNVLFYQKHNRSDHEFIVDYDTFFYPLDSIFNWNRIYGSRGFTQYQCVFPKETGREGVKCMLKKISDNRMGSFLAVLKLFGKGNNNLLSFPMEGYTLALDFSIKPGLFKLLDELDHIVSDYNGRLYLAKDVRMGKDMFYKSYLNAESFMCYKNKIDGARKIESLQSRRIGI